MNPPFAYGHPVCAADVPTGLLRLAASKGEIALVFRFAFVHEKKRHQAFVFLGSIGHARDPCTTAGRTCDAFALLQSMHSITPASLPITLTVCSDPVKLSVGGSYFSVRARVSSPLAQAWATLIARFCVRRPRAEGVLVVFSGEAATLSPGQCLFDSHESGLGLVCKDSKTVVFSTQLPEPRFFTFGTSPQDAE